MSLSLENSGDWGRLIKKKPGARKKGVRIKLVKGGVTGIWEIFIKTGLVHSTNYQED